MTPKEKAKEFVDRFVIHQNDDYPDSDEDYHAKQCALICVNEIIKEHCHESEHKDPLAQDRWIDYWQEVKQEINKL
jgi:hypothetical protein